MSTLYLTCGLCGRMQADGLLSRGAWGHLEAGADATLRACPTCKAANADWEARLLAGPSTGQAGPGAAFGVGESSFG
jgi:hypothetical protein